MTIRWACLLLLLPASVALAGQTVEVEPGGTYRVKASADNLTSIGMADGLRLQAVFGVETAVSISKDEAFGRVIIKPIGDEPFSLIVTDENGDSYALEVSPVSGSGGVITLKRKSHRPDAALVRARRDMPFTSRLKRIIKSIVRGEVPAGYTVERRDRVVPLWLEADFRLLSVYEGSMTVEHYRLRNVSASEMRLDEREFRILGEVVSVAIRRHVLPPQGTTDVFIVRSANVTGGLARDRT